MNIKIIAEHYIESGITSYSEIVKNCIALSETDVRLRNAMIWQFGSVGEFAAQLFDAVQEILINGNRQST